MSDGRWDLAACLEEVLAFRRARDWERFHRPKELATALAIEAAELQEAMLWKGDEEVAASLRDEAFRRHVEDEVADVAICLLMVAERLDVDLRRAVLRKVAANERRYPVEEHRGVARKAPPEQGAERGA